MIEYTDEQHDSLIRGHRKQLADAQATIAALQAIEQILDIDSGKTTVEKVRDLHHAFKQVWDSYQDASNEMFKAQAELERMQRERDRLREVLERVLEQWVNGRKVKDGICMEVLVAAKAALTPAGGGGMSTKGRGCDTLADRMFSAYLNHAVLEEQVQNAIICVLGKDPENPDSWGFDDLTFDYYDSSFELRGCREIFTLTDQQRRALREMGFHQCWFCEKPTEVYDKGVYIHLGKQEG